MGVNLIVWKWAATHDSDSKRRKLGIKYRDIAEGFNANGRHPAMAAHDFADFDSAVIEALGPTSPDGAYLVEHHPWARVFALPYSRVPELVMRIGALARKHKLTAVES